MSFITLLNTPLTQFFQHHYCAAALTFWGSVARRWNGSRFLLVVSALPSILSNDIQKSVFISFVHYNHTTQSFFSLFPHLEFTKVHVSFSHLILSSSMYILPKLAYDFVTHSCPSSNTPHHVPKHYKTH